MSSSDADGQHEERVEEVGNPGENRGYDADCHQLSSDASKGKKWRRRESKEQATLRTDIVSKRLTTTPNPLAGNRQETDGTSWLELSSLDPLLILIIEVWDDQPEHVQAAIVNLCRI